MKHRLAPLGFLIFHVSFIFICAGGALIYYTRFVGGVRLVEGQTFEGYFRDILRSPPLGVPAPFGFTLLEVDPTFERGEPTDLRVTLRPTTRGGSPTVAWVNNPANWGTRSVLVMAAGLAPQLWIQDAEGFTLDRISIAAATRAEEASRVPILEGKLMVEIKPVIQEGSFPSRQDLSRSRVDIVIHDQGGEVYRNRLRVGASADLAASVGEDGSNERLRIVVEDMRYWAGFLVVDERGGGLLIFGFVLAVVGAVWRLLTHRREIAMTWDDQEFRLNGRAEFFIGRFHDELESMSRIISAGTSHEENSSEDA